MDGFKIQYLRINNRVILGQNSLFVSKNLPLKLTSCHILKFIFFFYIFLNYPSDVISVYTINNHNVTQKLTSRTLRASRMLRAVTAVLLLSLLCTLCSSFVLQLQLQLREALLDPSSAALPRKADWPPPPSCFCIREHLLKWCITSQELFALKFLPRSWLCFDAPYLNGPQWLFRVWLQWHQLWSL